MMDAHCIWAGDRDGCFMESGRVLDDKMAMCIQDSMAASGQPITGSHDKGTYFLTEYLRIGDVAKQTEGG